MKQNGNILSIVALVAVGILYILFFTQKPSKANRANKPTSDTTEELTNIAFFNTDTINSKVDYIKRNEEALNSKQKRIDAELQRDQKNLQTRMQNFQKKAQEGGYSQVTGEAESKAIAQQQQKLEKKNSQYMDQLLKEQQAHAEKLNKALKESLKEINHKANYDYIFSYADGGAIFEPNEALDITEDVIEKLNAKLD